MKRAFWIGFGVAALLWLSLLPLSAAPSADTSLPPECTSNGSDLCHRGQVAAHPPNPSTADPVSIIVSGWWGSSCPAVTYEHSMVGHSITLSMTVTDLVSVPPVGCLDVVTPWTITQEMGILPPGDYTVQAECSAGPCWSFQAKTAFRVWAPAGMFWCYLPSVLCKFDNSIR
jgi:hypothetical protein